MKLSFEKIKELAVGVIDVTQNEDGIINFHRFTPDQLDAFGMQSEGVRKNATSTTGNRLDFETDSKNLTFTVAGDGKYEVLVNTLPIYCNGLKKGESASIELEEGTKRITLLMPSHSVGALYSVELDDDATANRHKFDCRALFIGDSITQGWNSAFDSMSWAYRTSFHLNAHSLILGVGGATYHTPSFPIVPGYNPDYVFIKLGTNDYHHYKTMQESLYHQIGFLRKATYHYKDAKIYVITPIYRLDLDKVPPMGDWWEYVEKLAEQAKSFDVTLIDGNKLMPHFEKFFADALHPNDLGFASITLNLIKQL